MKLSSALGSLGYDAWSKEVEMMENIVDAARTMVDALENKPLEKVADATDDLWAALAHFDAESDRTED